MPRWYSVRPGFLRMASCCAPSQHGGGAVSRRPSCAAGQGARRPGRSPSPPPGCPAARTGWTSRRCGPPPSAGPGRIAIFQNATSPSFFIMALVKSASPTLTPPLVMMASALRGRVAEGLLQQRRLVAHHAQVDHLAAQARAAAVHRVAVAVVHRAFARRLAQAQDLVAGGEVGHLQAPQHATSAMPRLATGRRRRGRGARRAQRGLALHQVLALRGGCRRAAAAGRDLDAAVGQRAW
jgi:hypothetical protein